MSITDYNRVGYLSHDDSGTDFERESDGSVVIEVTVDSDYYAGHTITKYITISAADWSVIVAKIGA